MKVNACIGCGGKQPVSYGSSDGFDEVIGQKKFTQEAYSILKCNHCGLYYKDHVLDETQLNDYYNSFDFKAWEPAGNYPTEDIVEQYLLSKTGLTLLDYGCSEGRFISKFIGRHACYGFDIDQRALALAEKKGITVLNGTLLRENNTRFDAIVLSDVFEHAMAPTKLVHDLVQMLNENGLLIITTGYADAKACQYDLPHFWYFRTVQHVCMLGEKYIGYLEAHCGLRVVDKKFCSHYHSGFSKRLFYGLRFGLFRFVNNNRKSWLVRIFSVLPGLKKITQWKVLPYHPFSKDHVVLFLQRKGG